MSAGVAVLFKKQFGKPENTNYVRDHLTYQQVKEGAAIYSLVTKLKFNLKPKEHEYNTAFEEFTEDFQRRNLKHLVCSPMGCMRDNIPPKLFAKNIINFQKATGAKIAVVVFNEKSYSKLRKGLSHSELLKELRDLLVVQESEKLAAIHPTSPISATTHEASLKQANKTEDSFKVVSKDEQCVEVSKESNGVSDRVINNSSSLSSVVLNDLN